MLSRAILVWMRSARDKPRLLLTAQARPNTPWKTAAAPGVPTERMVRTWNLQSRFVLSLSSWMLELSSATHVTPGSRRAGTSSLARRSGGRACFRGLLLIAPTAVPSYNTGDPGPWGCYNCRRRRSRRISCTGAWPHRTFAGTISHLSLVNSCSNDAHPLDGSLTLTCRSLQFRHPLLDFWWTLRRRGAWPRPLSCGGRVIWSDLHV
jgi:hypothetical protein